MIGCATEKIQLSVNFPPIGMKRFFLRRNEKAVERYKKFLLLKKKYPDQKLVPTTDIDHYWHLHLEHPVSYYNDCMRLFGRIVNHCGGFGRDKSQRKEWKNRFKNTETLWQEEYSEPYKLNFFSKGKYCNSD